MDSPSGRILAVRNDANPRRAEIEMMSAPRCARCAAGKGCGAGLVGEDGRLRRVDAMIPAGYDVTVGDEVRIELAPDSVLAAARLVYGLPLAGAVLGAGTAYLAGLGDAGAATTALAGLVAGAFLGRVLLRRDRCLSRFTPTIVAHE